MSSDLEIRPVSTADAARIADLHRAAFGPGRFARTAYRVREGTPEFTPYCRAAFVAGRLKASLRMTPISIGGREGALLLGPLAVEPADRGRGFGRALIASALADAAAAGIEIVVLVGDLPYYGRFGFKVIPPGQIVLPGPVNPQRLLAAELSQGALGRFHGTIGAA